MTSYYGSLGENPHSQPLLGPSGGNDIDDIDPNSLKVGLVGAKRRSPSSFGPKGSKRTLSFQTTEQQRPVLKTVVSKRVIKRSNDGTRIPLPRPTTTNVRKKSFIYTMLNPRSTAWQAITFKWFISTLIVMDLVIFVVSTEPNLSIGQEAMSGAWEAGTSGIFLTEYILRLLTVTESNKYGSRGCCVGRLRYAITAPAIIDLVASVPYFLERFTGWNLPTLTYLRAFRLLRILKTQGFSEATKSVCRVFFYNSEILTVALWIGVGLVLFTAVLMYYFRPRESDHPQFRSLSSTMYLATLMLTGQGGPDGEIPWYTSFVVLLTGIFSIGMFAIPASMLTWGFEGEAARLAKHRFMMASGQLRTTSASTEEDGIHDDWSYSSDDYSTDDEYLKTIAGEDDSDGEDETKRLLHDFQMADVDGSGTISLTEFIKLSRETKATAAQSKVETVNTDVAPRLTSRLDELEKKVEANGEKMDRILALLEALNAKQI